MSTSIEDKFCRNMTIAEAFLVAGRRLPKELGERIKFFGRVGGLPGEMIAKLELLIDHISSPDFGGKEGCQP